MNKSHLLILTSLLVLFSSFPLKASAQPDRVAYQRPGKVVVSLPRQHRVVTVRGNNYFFSGGVYYERRGSNYVVMRSPVGARITSLPAGYISLTLGGRRYYRLNSTYYLYDEPSRSYVVVDEPEGASEITGDLADSQSTDFYVYPTQGQTEEQTDQDRYECHRWARDESGYDPSQSNQDSSLSGDYNRAISACLEGMGYTVR